MKAFDLEEPAWIEFSTTYGIQPRDPQHTTVARRISLKDDFQWREKENLQKVMKAADTWESFPEDDLRLIAAEVKAGIEPQRIDLLYLRDDGGVFPCELKVGGNSLDTHGQLLRYMATLSNQEISREWVLSQRKKYLKRIYEDCNQADQNIRIDLAKFEDGISAFPDDEFHVLDFGIIIDEGFPEALVTAVKFLNLRSQLSIRLMQLDAFVANDWNFDDEEFVMRLELNEVPLGENPEFGLRD